MIPERRRNFIIRLKSLSRQLSLMDDCVMDSAIFFYEYSICRVCTHYEELNTFSDAIIAWWHANSVAPK